MVAIRPQFDETGDQLPPIMTTMITIAIDLTVVDNYAQMGLLCLSRSIYPRDRFKSPL